MYARGSKRGTVRFTVSPIRGAARVLLAGDFTQWEPVAMNMREDGSFEKALPLKPGQYQYKFVLDGQWIKDPDNSCWAINPDGTLNSVANID